MHVISLSELGEKKVYFDDPEVFPESWATRKSFSHYKTVPRPCSALFFIKNDLQVHFYPANGTRITVKKGGAVYIPEGVCYHVQVEGGTPNGIDTYTVNHTLRDACGEVILPARTITLLCERAESSLDLHFQKLSEAIHQSAGQLRIYGCMYTLLDAVITAAAGTGSAYYSIRIGVERLREEWYLNRKIEAYAKLCNMSNAYFYRCFRAWSGQSPVEYRNALRLSHAESMLRNTDMQIKEIAETVGFEDPFYFCRVFAKRFGVSPKKYRNGVNFKSFSEG